MIGVFILDTDIVSNFRRRHPNPNLTTWIESIPPEDLAISVMTIFEIQTGAFLVRRTNRAKADDIEQWLEGFVLTAGFGILAVDAAIARLYARMFVTPSLMNFLLPDQRSQRPKSGADLVIAATAIAHGATIVTGNTADFLRIHALFPLPSLYDPLRNRWSIAASLASHTKI